jgi:hypothetical protein
LPAAVRNVTFRHLLSALVTSEFGSSITFLLIPIVAVKSVQASPFQVSLLVALSLGVPAVLSLPFGAWLRNAPLLLTMAASDLARAVALIVAAALFVLDRGSYGMLVVLSLVVAVGSLLFEIANRSVLPLLVSEDELMDANGKLESATLVSSAAGLGASGFIARWLTAPVGFFLDAATYLVSAANIAAIHRILRRAGKAPVLPDEDEEPGLSRSTVRAGLGYVLRHPIIGRCTAAASLSLLFSSAQAGLFVVFLLDTAHVSETWIGISFTAGTVCAALAANMVGRLTAAVGSARALLFLFLGEGVAAALLPLTGEGWRIAVLVISVIGSECSVLAFNIIQVTYRQQETPRHLLVDVNASVRFFLGLARPAGALLGGIAAAALGSTLTVMWVVAAGMLGSSLVLFTSPLWSLRDLPRTQQPA